MHLSRALTLTEELVFFISDYITSEQVYYKYLVVPVTGGKKQSPKNVGNVFLFPHYLTCPTAIT